MLAEAPTDIGVGSPSWSPDGRSIAYEHGGDLRIAQASASGRLLIAHGASSFAWSPDGRSIAYASGYPEDVLIADVGRRTVRPLHLTRRGISSRRWSQITALSWSPDGRLLALASKNSNKYQTRLWVIRSDGSGRRQVASGGDNSLAGWTTIAPARR